VTAKDTARENEARKRLAALGWSIVLEQPAVEPDPLAANPGAPARYRIERRGLATLPHFEAGSLTACAQLAEGWNDWQSKLKPEARLQPGASGVVPVLAAHEGDKAQQERAPKQTRVASIIRGEAL